MLALDADTGKLKWHYQFSPHDVHDYDATQIPVLLDAPWPGQPRKLLHANRNGFLYVLDRTNGQFLSGKPFFTRVTWAKGIGLDGRPFIAPGSEKTWGAPRAFDPFTAEKKWEFKYFSPPNGGALSTAGGIVFARDSDGIFIAFDARTGKDLWHIQLGAAVCSSPMIYSLGGRQFVAIPAGAALFAFALPGQ